MINVIFLDIDNVINYGYAKEGLSENDVYGFAPALVSNLKYIVDNVPFTKIVISSSWRMTQKMDHISKTRNWRNVLEKQLGCHVVGSLIIDDIPHVNEYPTDDGFDCSNKRGEDIKTWLSMNKWRGIGSFVIIDDNISCGTIPKYFPNNFVNCDALQIGECLSMRNAKQAIWILTNNGKNYKMNDNVWFTADTHFHHANIIKYCSRPYVDVPEMNEKLIENWNSVVGKNDIVWHLGDFSFGSRDKLEAMFKQLNGKINIVLGNHDKLKVSDYYEIGFHRVYDVPVIINDFFMLSHQPIQWITDSMPYVNIYGHVHNSGMYSTWTKNTCCACVERHDYTPISWKYIIERLKTNNEENCNV